MHVFFLTGSMFFIQRNSFITKTFFLFLSSYLQVCNSVVDVAVMQEAHGLIMDMLADPAIPSNVVSGLKTVSSLLSPPSSFNTVQRPNISPLVALTESRSADMEDSPYGGGERPLSLPKVCARLTPCNLLWLILLFCLMWPAHVTIKIGHFTVKFCQDLKWSHCKL